ncbi:hypothetical protein [Natrinema sp. DC36]|uniref:hypothetical protein n=1 Tax=Natrinema sp. DC36 TaxID=2878680 RepID=UPI001CF0483E|nr:hypothetical protein [Natrinema sp. DC36]
MSNTTVDRDQRGAGTRDEYAVAGFSIRLNLAERRCERFHRPSTPVLTLSTAGTPEGVIFPSGVTLRNRRGVFPNEDGRVPATRAAHPWRRSVGLAAVERKSFEDLAGSLGLGRKNFEVEVQRAGSLMDFIVVIELPRHLVQHYVDARAKR